MEPSSSRQPTDINEEAESVPNTTHTETKTGDIEIGDELEASSGDNDNIQPLRNLSIDEIERKDFELENRLINLHSQEIEDTECLTASSNCDAGISCANSSTTHSNENKCSLILNAVNDECNVKIDTHEVQFELSDDKKSNTPDNCCLKKNHVYTMNFTPPKPVRPFSIPKYKLFEFEEVHEESDQSKPCENNEDVFETCNNQSIDCQSNNSKEICLDPHENDSSSSNVYDLSNGCERITEDCDEMIDKTDHNYSIASAKFKDSFDYMNQTGHGSSHGLNTKDLLTADDSEVPSNILSNEHSMLFPDYEDPDTGEAEEDEVVCTCVSSFNDNIYVADDKQICDDEMASLSTSDSEVPNHSVSENSRLLRKRKVKTSPTCTSTKKQYIDVTAEPKNSKVPEYPPEGQDWLNRFSLWSGSDRLKAIDLLIGHCAADQVRHMMQAIEPLFQRDFISLLPRELALAVLGYLMPKDLLRAAHTCKYWRYLADDNLLWKEQCRRINVAVLPRCVRSKSLSDTTWKAAYIRQHMIEKNWLRKPTDSPKILKGHDDHVITCLQFYGNKIVSGSDDTTLKVWSAITGRCLRTLVGHTGGVWSSQMIGRTIISGSTDRTLRIWDANTGACLRTLTGHTSTVRCMHLCNDKVVSGSRDATLRVWSVPDGRCLRVLVGHMAAVRCVQYNGNRVVSGAYDYFVKIWNPDTAECLHTLAGHSNRVYSLQFDGVHIVTGSLDTSIMVWDVESGALKHTLRGHQSITSGMELRSNILMSGNADSTVKIWDIISGQCLHTLTGQNKHQSAVTCVQSNNRFVITSSDDGTVKLWDLKTGEFIRNLVTLSSGGSGGVVWRIRASSTKLVCAVGSRNGTEDTKLMVLDFDIPGACSRCDIL